MVDVSIKLANNYHVSYCSKNYLGVVPNRIRTLKGVYLTKFHIVKIFNFIIILGSGYK